MGTERLSRVGGAEVLPPEELLVAQDGEKARAREAATGWEERRRMVVGLEWDFAVSFLGRVATQWPLEPGQASTWPISSASIQFTPSWCDSGPASSASTSQGTTLFRLCRHRSAGEFQTNAYSYYFSTLADKIYCCQFGCRIAVLFQTHRLKS